MFADQTLTPKEAVRLCLLGSIAQQPMHYGQLAGSVRHFVTRVAGPQIELLGLSVELLKYEGLVEAAEGEGIDDDALIAITEAGRRELHNLLTARLRAGSDLSKLIIALKFRFLHLLEATEQRAQIDLLLDAVEGELARLLDLRQSQAAEAGHLLVWLDHEITALEGQLAWLEEFQRGL